MRYNNKEQVSELITCRLLNGSNDGSILGNKRFLISYVNVNTSVFDRTKTFIGCFVNPADMSLSYYFDKKQKLTDLINNNTYYFRMEMNTKRLFTVEKLLKQVIWSKGYSNSVTKKILHEKYPDIIKKCETKLKEGIEYLIYN